MYTCAYGSFEKGCSETSVLLSLSIALKCLHGFRWFLTTAKGSPQCSRLTLPQCEVLTSAVTDRPSVQPPMTRPSKWVTLQNTASLRVCVCVCVCVVRVIEYFKGWVCVCVGCKGYWMFQRVCVGCKGYWMFTEGVLWGTLSLYYFGNCTVQETFSVTVLLGSRP